MIIVGILDGANGRVNAFGRRLDETLAPGGEIESKLRVLLSDLTWLKIADLG